MNLRVGCAALASIGPFPRQESVVFLHIHITVRTSLTWTGTCLFPGRVTFDSTPRLAWGLCGKAMLPTRVVWIPRPIDGKSLEGALSGWLVGREVKGRAYICLKCARPVSECPASAIMAVSCSFFFNPMMRCDAMCTFFFVSCHTIHPRCAEPIC
ncbi:hypothetical protein VTO42DRAFT_7035 [Malbranchea cinnamomea]